MAAALWTLGLATALLGVMLIVIGRLRLASLAQYLPVPVVGGYLAYIGFYCGQAGLAMMSGVEVTHLRDWPKLFHGSGPAKMCVGVVVASAIVLTSSIAEKKKVVAGVQVADHAFGSSCDLCRSSTSFSTCARLDARGSA